ncbi:MAG: hypothetical protein OXF65_00225 [Acidimicrobiaceae bacterium]|nr:hypothetical protein [Acidimicrobiaceae bacterium]
MNYELPDELHHGGTFLLTWNPDDWELTVEEYYARVLITATTGGFMNGWTLGTNFRQMGVGDEVFVHRHGGFGGIVAHGFAVCDPYPGDADGIEVDEASKDSWWIQVAWSLWKPLEVRLRPEDLAEIAPVTFGAPIRASGHGVDAEEADALRHAFYD